MSELTAVKTWTVSTQLHPEEPTTFHTSTGAVHDLAALSPVEQLLLAIGSCFGQSCLNLMRFHRIPVSGLDVTVEGHRPEGPIIGKGLDAVTIGVRFLSELSTGQKARLLDDAQKVCTVSNTLSDTLALTVNTVDGSDT